MCVLFFVLRDKVEGVKYEYEITCLPPGRGWEPSPIRKWGLGLFRVWVDGWPRAGGVW